MVLIFFLKFLSWSVNHGSGSSVASHLCPPLSASFHCWTVSPRLTAVSLWLETPKCHVSSTATGAEQAREAPELYVAALQFSCGLSKYNSALLLNKVDQHKHDSEKSSAYIFLLSKCKIKILWQHIDFVLKCFFHWKSSWMISDQLW